MAKVKAGSFLLILMLLLAACSPAPSRGLPESEYMALERFYAATGGETVLTADDVRALRTQRVEPCNPAVPTLLLLDAGDEVLDYRLAEAAFRGCGKTIVYPGGSHRFDHLAEALPEIRALVAG